MTVAALSQTCGVAPVLWMRPRHVGYLGPDLGVGMHDTAIACLGLALDGPFTVDTAEYGTLVTSSVFVPARVRHRIVSQGRIALLFAEPGSAVTGCALSGTLGPCAIDAGEEAALIAAARAGVTSLERLISDPKPLRPIDPRIETIVREIRADPAAHPRAEDAAAAAGLSEYYFLRMFAAHTGTTFRRYRQWARVRMVFVGVEAGHDLTRCAADAGFASPSHLSETFRRTFGLSLTAVLNSRVTLDIR
ncbi:helix-turn-helix domain-containing protein [Nocardia sp. NBC_01327]|uniref:helix-turn-helix domain-containing protein n=1 Tax=Nocardia sp. NBC_01327 TaxID=2903593 RepID=UPI002E157D29|nr:AraC family transcriptional regulator [Nocardia sp. NBC_01327]